MESDYCVSKTKIKKMIVKIKCECNLPWSLLGLNFTFLEVLSDWSLPESLLKLISGFFYLFLLLREGANVTSIYIFKSS